MTTMSTQINGHAGGSGEGNQTSASKIQPNDVGWQFVPQYYNFVNKQPHRLHCFYNKRSTFVHGEEGEEAQTALGQQEIHDRITAIGYDQCKVYIHSIDSQSSANGGIIILVIGEMSNKNQPWRKFTQTFFLAEQPNGYFVLNDIFRYLKEEVDDDEEEGEADPAAQDVAVEVPPSAPAVLPQAEPVPVPDPIEVETKIREEPIADGGSTLGSGPEPVTEPAHPDPETVPEEAIIASVPDQDIAPEEVSIAVEEPTTATQPPLDELDTHPEPAPAPVVAESTPAVNGTQAPPAAAAPAKPSAPKSWASLAASASKGAWGAAPAPRAPAAAPAPTPAPAAAAAPPAPVQVKEQPPAPAPSTSGPPPPGQHPFFTNAMKVQTPHCFVKLPNWSAEGASNGTETMDEAALRAIAGRFGDVAKVEIVKSKACAFVEFAKVESARKAIIASLATNQGGEGGVKAGEGKLNFETRKEKDERRPKGTRGGVPERGGPPRGGGGVGQNGPREGNGERNGPGSGGPGRGRGRGRGGPPNGGGGGDRPQPPK